MQPRSSFDRTLLIPVVIGIVSIVGICWIFLISGLGRKVLPPTATPSSFSSPEAATQTPSRSAISTHDEIRPTALVTGPDTSAGTLAELPSSTSTVVTASLSTPSATLTPDRIQPFRAGKHDDTDPNIAYDTYWTALKNPSTATSYKGTIHASSDSGSEASFRFTGKQVRLGYKRAKSFGTVTVIIDGQSYRFNEQAFDLVWSSPRLSPGDHFVQIIHESGESVNLDYVEILD